MHEIYVITQERALNVVAADPVAKTITVKYGGAYSGTYDLVVTNPSGNVFSDVTFAATFEITDFTPKTGSVYGGTLVTITGRHFSDDDPTQNPVKIGYEYITGTDHYCYIVETSEYEIKCRTAIDTGRQPSTTEVIVFASTSEEASCNVPGDDGCAFEYVDMSSSTTALTSASASFLSVTETYQVLIEGVDIEDTLPESV